MIKCIVKKNSINMSGHAQYNEHGNDIVCAGASMLAYAIGDKALAIDDKTLFEVDDNGELYFEVDIKNNDLKLLLDTLINGLKMLQEQYQEHIKIEEA